MENKVITDENGRKYQALVEGNQEIIIGPPEGLVDALGLQEPSATRLHNVLFQRGMFLYKDIAAGKNAFACLQEALGVDAQKLVEAYYKLEGGPS